MSQFSQKLCKLEFSNLVNVWRMSDYIVGLRIGLIAFWSFFFIIFFFLFLFHTFELNIYVIVFSGTIESRHLKLNTHMEKELLYGGI